MDINLSDIYYFIEMAKSQNLSHAAVRLGLTQPTLSVALVRIENALGSKLFERSKKGLLLTPAGRSFLLHARQLQQNWESVKTKTQAAHNEVKGRYVLGAHPSVAIYTFPNVLTELLADNPELEIQFKHDLSRKILDGVILGHIDIGVVVNPVRHPNLIIKKISDDQVCLWKSAKNKIVADVLIGDSELVQTQTLIKKLEKAKINFTRTVSSSNLELIASLAEAGAGIGILPKKIADNFKGLEMVKSAPVFHDEICLVYRAEMRPVKAIQIISETLQKVFV